MDAGQSEAWPSEATAGMPFKKTTENRIFLTAFHQKKPDGPQLLILPERLQILKVDQNNILALTQFINSGEKTPNPILGFTESIYRTFIFICCHLNRDKRCGTLGPLLVTEFETVLKNLNINNVTVEAVSHVGGHKFAGNVIIYNEIEEKMVADWYGRVKVCNVEMIVRETVVGKKVINELWRGRVDDW
jgi:hypothetical protein